MTEPKAEVLDTDHPIANLANSLSDQAYELSARLGISRWDLCVALANACGQILADSGKPPPEGITTSGRGKDMPREVALKRMDGLREIMQGAYDLRNTEGEA